MAWRCAAVLAAALAALAAEAQPVAISVDLGHPIGPHKPIFAWFGYDEANYTTMPGGKALLAELHDLSPVPVHIRTHHLLTSGDGVAALKWSSTGVYSEDAQGRPVYDFRLFDGIFDEFRAAGVVPMVELGFTPRPLASEAGRYEDVYPDSALGGTVQSPPKDLAKWQALIRAVTSHLVERYGRATVADWFFEVWNEPDIPYWHGTEEQYFELYDRTAAAVRDVLPQARIGGPATTGPAGASGGRFLEDFLAHAERSNVPLDFISFHAKGRPSIEGGHVIMGLEQELADVDHGFALIKRFPRFAHLPVILSEADPEGCAACSAKVNPANAYRNGTLYPAYTAAAYKRLFELADRYGIDLISMLSWSFEFENHDYFEGFRSLSTNGIDKPILNFFRMAALLRGTRVAASGANAFATADSAGAAIMLWNYRDEAGPGPSQPVSITISGVPARVRLTHYRIDDTHSNAYSAWQAMGSPQNPSAAQLAELKSKAGLQTLEPPRSLAAADGKITVTTEMPLQSVSLLQLDWH